MFRFLILPIFLIPAPEGVLPGPFESRQGGGHLLVTVHMGGEGFMCPFLTPQFIDVVDDRAHWTRALPLESSVQFAVALDQSWTQDGLLDVLTSIGYPEDGASFLQWDTLAVVPPMPEP